MITKMLGQHNILLLGVVGSRAYGLQTAQSDVDRLGIFAAPTSQFHGLRRPTETVRWEAPEPDITIHEAGKWCLQAMKSNPTTIELVWLPDQFIEEITDWGAELRTIRGCFPTAKSVRNSYMGYAASQVTRLTNRNDGSFSSDTRKRTAKHARHVMRLCWQGLEFYRTGKLPIQVDDPQKFHAFGTRVADGDLAAAEDLIKQYGNAFDRATTPLGDRPDEERIERWLRAVRHAYWKEAEDVHAVQQRSAHLHAELLARRPGARRANDR